MMPIQTADVERFRALIEEKLGLSCADWQEERLPGLLRDRMNRSHFNDAASYLYFLAGAEGAQAELAALAAELTVGETYFYREPRQLDALVSVAVPALLPKRRRVNGPLRVLSAGCSSGEEAYSVALALKEHAEFAPIEAQIIGVDMNPAALKRAREAVYSAWSMRGTPTRVKDKWFTASGQGFHLRPEIRSMVTFEQRNLLSDDSSFFRPGSFDIVFCRNVTIYFSAEATRKVMAKIEQCIVPGGFLFLGHSETLRGISDEFELMHTHETFYYQKRGSIQPAAPGAAARSESDRPKATEGTLTFDADGWVAAIQRSSARIEEVTRQLDEAPARDSRPPPDRDSRPPTPDRDSRPPAPDRDSRPPPELGEAQDLFQAERFEDALLVLKRLREHSHGDPEVELLTAVIYFNQGLFPDAERICVSAIGQGARGPAAHYLLGLCREHEGSRGSAMDHYRSAIRLDPTFSMPHLRLGRLARHAGDIETARTEIRLAAVLIARERADRIVLFGGGFHRNALLELCRSELQAAGETL